jgi:hypothetical protein
VGAGASQHSRIIRVFLPVSLYTVLPRNKLTLRFRCGSWLRFVRFAVAVRAVCGRCSCGLRLRFVQFAVAVRRVCGCGPCGFFTDRRKPCRRVPAFPDYNDYHTLSNYKIYISILRLYLYTGTRDMNFTVGYK